MLVTFKFFLAISFLVLGFSSVAVSAEESIDWHVSCDLEKCTKKSYGVSRDEMTWLEAQEFCSSVGEGLATFKTAPEEEVFHDAWSK